ncbi:hypothetical protein AHAT_25430 [Agarivorans sp. Toyoura001]|nr:hypothetical protein AHAT_25430 [Agarivorans sp. Toyoura001]
MGPLNSHNTMPTSGSKQIKNIQRYLRPISALLFKIFTMANMSPTKITMANNNDRDIVTPR